MVQVEPQSPTRRKEAKVALSKLDQPAVAAPAFAAETSLIERVRWVKEMMLTEASAITAAAAFVAPSAVDAAVRVAHCQGSVVLTGVGKAGWIAQKLVATLSSTGSPSHFLHPCEAVHGDLGRVKSDDLVIAFSNSGRSEEVLRIAPQLKSQSSGLIAITADSNNPLASIADCVVAYGRHPEACRDGLAPTTSTTVMLAVGDAIAMLASRLRGFSAEDFGRFHPGGALGRKLTNVDQVMRPIEQCRVASEDGSIRDSLAIGPGTRRSGAVMLVNREGQLTGIFTDSDLARLLQNRRENSLDDSIARHMTRTPITLLSGSKLGDAMNILSKRRISELPIVATDGLPVGMIDITDLMAVGDVPVPEAPKTVLTVFRSNENST